MIDKLRNLANINYKTGLIIFDDEPTEEMISFLYDEGCFLNSIVNHNTWEASKELLNVLVKK